MTSWPTGSVALLLKRQRWGHHSPWWPLLPSLRPQSSESLPESPGRRICRAEPRDPLEDASSGMDPPVGDGLQSTAVAAGQPERTVSEDVGTVGDAQDQQVAPRRLQQGLQPCFQTATGDGQEVRERFVATSCSEKHLHIILGLWPRNTLLLIHPPTAVSPSAPGILLLAFLLAPLPRLQVLQCQRVGLGAPLSQHCQEL